MMPGRVCKVLSFISQSGRYDLRIFDLVGGWGAWGEVVVQEVRRQRNSTKT